jgi:hypothetical protein
MVRSVAGILKLRGDGPTGCGLKLRWGLPDRGRDDSTPAGVPDSRRFRCYHAGAMSFPGGSAYSMARDVAEGFSNVTERTFRNLTPAELDQLTFEIDRHVRELRGENPASTDTAALQMRHRRIQRMNSALVVLRAYRQKSRR